MIFGWKNNPQWVQYYANIAYGRNRARGEIIKSEAERRNQVLRQADRWPSNSGNPSLGNFRSAY